jgi:hypothetical protein
VQHSSSSSNGNSSSNGDNGDADPSHAASASSEDSNAGGKQHASVCIDIIQLSSMRMHTRTACLPCNCSAAVELLYAVLQQDALKAVGVLSYAFPIDANCHPSFGLPAAAACVHVFLFPSRAVLQQGELALHGPMLFLISINCRPSLSLAAAAAAAAACVHMLWLSRSAAAG